MVVSIDISGQRYGRLLAIKRVANLGRRTQWLFECDCGSRPILSLERVRLGQTKSCGCLRIDVTRARSLTHGHRVNRMTTRTRKAYEHAKSRCYNQNDEKYPQYGGRGITMCSAWLNDFTAFLRDMGECPPGMSIDRVDVNGNYEPRNCRWANSRQQARTRTNNVLVLYEGNFMILKDFAALIGVGYKALHGRVKYKGQDPHDAAKEMLARRPR